MPNGPQSRRALSATAVDREILREQRAGRRARRRRGCRCVAVNGSRVINDAREVELGLRFRRERERLLHERIAVELRELLGHQRRPSGRGTAAFRADRSSRAGDTSRRDSPRRTTRAPRPARRPASSRCARRRRAATRRQRWDSRPRRSWRGACSPCATRIGASADKQRSAYRRRAPPVVAGSRQVPARRPSAHGSSGASASVTNGWQISGGPADGSRREPTAAASTAAMREGTVGWQT